MKKLKLIISKGLPASGKSNFAKKFVLENQGWSRVNRDDIRRMLGKYWLPEREDLVTSIEKDTTYKTLAYGHNVILDSTNFHPNVEKWTDEMIDLLKKQNLIEVTKEIKDFTDVDVDECIKRDKKRGEESVGENVIRRMAKKYLGNSYREKNKFSPAIQDESLPHAILCDLDGTLAYNSWRSPFDYKECDKDPCYNHIKDIVNRFFNTHKIIMMSGRKEEGRDSTLKFLFKNDIKFDYLFMRGNDDNRKDSITKKELYEKNVKDKYHVDFVIDDRSQVVKMWREELGLYCLQVQDHNF